MGITVHQVREAFESCEDKQEGLIKAAWLFDNSVDDPQSAEVMIRWQLHNLLEREKYITAGTLLWGRDRWNDGPKSVGQIFEHYRGSAKGIIIGCGSAGKSYTLIGLTLLDWVRDPEWTSVKIISTTSGHAKANTFSTMVSLHKEAIISLPGNQMEGFIGLDSTGDRRSSISVLAIPAGDDGKGRLQGFHPVPRPNPHPTFGNMSRIRAILDEAEEVPAGVWQGIGNLLGSMHGPETIKVMCATNPKNVATQLANNAEPVGGWDVVDLDTDTKWKSQEGWDVLRLDGASCENVVHRKLIYPGMMTIEGYENFLFKNGGNSPDYFTFARGIYPMNGVVDTIISSESITKCRGEFQFVGRPTYIIGCDIAVDGRDKCAVALGRFGTADGFMTMAGELIRFYPRPVVQLDHVQEIEKGDTKKVGDNLIKFSKAMAVDPRWIGVDRTGNGASVHDYIRAILSPDVFGVDFSEESSEMKILEEDKEAPRAEYQGVVTEVWFALQKYINAGCFAIAPNCQMEPLRRQLIGRRYTLGDGKRIRVQKKDDYKKGNNGRSPDEADAVTIMLHTYRMQGGSIPSMTESKARVERNHGPIRHGVVDEIKFIETGEF